MARFALHLQFTYARNRDANDARSALQQVLANHPAVTGSVASIGATLTFDGDAPDRAAAEAFQADAVGAWGIGTRTDGYSTMNRVGEA